MTEGPKDYVFQATPGSPCRSWIIPGYIWAGLQHEQKVAIATGWRRYVERCYDRRDRARKMQMLITLYGQNSEDSELQDLGSPETAPQSPD